MNECWTVCGTVAGSECMNEVTTQIIARQNFLCIFPGTIICPGSVQLRARDIKWRLLASHATCIITDANTAETVDQVKMKYSITIFYTFTWISEKKGDLPRSVLLAIELEIPEICSGYCSHTRDLPCAFSWTWAGFYSIDSLWWSRPLQTTYWICLVCNHGDWYKYTLSRFENNQLISLPP